MTNRNRSESEFILDFFDSDIFEMYEIYHHFRCLGHAVASGMRKEIENQVKECPDFRVWWREVLAEENFADFSG